MSVDVQDFKSAYLRLCAEQRVDVQDSVVRSILK